MNRKILFTVLLSFFGFVHLAYADTVVLSWTAVGDDGQLGTAYEYDLRYDTSPINQENFYLATRFEKIGQPNSPGSLEQVIVDELTGGVTYYFALKVADEKGNWSFISNVIPRIACEEGCVGMRGNIDGDINDQIDISDLLYLVGYMFKGETYPGPHCDLEADMDGSNQVDITDLLYMIDYMFQDPAGPPPVNCP